MERGQTASLPYVKLAHVAPGLLKDSQISCPSSSTEEGCLDLQQCCHFMALLENTEPGPGPAGTLLASAGSGDWHSVRSWLYFWMGTRFGYVLAYLGSSAASGAAAVWGEWPVAMDLLSLAALLAEQRKGL